MDHAPGQSTDVVENTLEGVADRFLHEIDNPTTPDRNPASQHQAPQEAETAPAEDKTEEAPAEESQEATSETDDSEVEINGKSYRLPKEIAELATEGHKRGLREADYTRKTQEVAEGRKQVDRMTQAAKTLFDRAQQFAPFFGQVQLLDQQLQGFGKVLTPELRANDPIQYNTLQTEALMLMRQRDGMAQQLQQATSQYQQQVDSFRAQQLAEAAPQLAKDIPGFEKTEVRRSLAEWGAHNGLSGEDLQAINWSPGLFRLLHMAKSFVEMKSTSEKAAEKVKEKLKTLPPAKPTGRSQEDPAGRDQKLREQWKKGGGKVSDPAFDKLLDGKLERFGF